jgi:WXG100 family type VII secretion target
MSPSTGGSYISTDVAGMTRAQGAMQEIYGDLNGAMQMLEEQQSSLAASWTGDAASTFSNALANFINDFRTINSALTGMMNAMSQNTGVYVNTNDTSTSMAQSFSNTTTGMPPLPGL